MPTLEQKPTIVAPQTRQSFDKRLISVVNQINAAKNIDEILIDLKVPILSLFDADRLTIYAVAPNRKEIVSKTKTTDEVLEIRVPINNKSISGFVALTGKMVTIRSVYDVVEIKSIHAELEFDQSWDKKTGYVTRQVLCMPIAFQQKTHGVLQLINKTTGSRFTAEDAGWAESIAEVLGIAFNNHTKAQRRVRTRFDLLLDERLISPEDLEAALAVPRKRGHDVESLLMEEYGLTKADIGRSLAAHYRCEFMEFSPAITIPFDLTAKVQDKYDFLKRQSWMPITLQDSKATVIIDNPMDLTKLDTITMILKPFSVEYVVGLREDILKFIAHAQGAVIRDGGSIEDLLTDLEPEEEEEGGGYDGELTDSDSVIIKVANQIIRDAYRLGVSDIHIEPYPGRRPCVVRFRVDGACYKYQEVPASHSRALVSRLKIMSALDIAERRKPQDGKIKFKIDGTRAIELRVATIPTQGAQEDVVMRILSASEPLPLSQMGFSDWNLAALKEMAVKPYGLILCVGPTGSGKTTTLHSVLGYINTPERKIWTAEDPVEITQYGLRQVQTLPKIGLTFATAMRAFLRADPDVIMVGEMRDKETAHTSIEASLTGHLVLSTLHTNSAPETITRLLDMGLDPFSFADALLGIVAQRLARTLCTSCKEAYRPSEEERHELVVEYGEEYASELTLDDPELKCCKPVGCDACNKTGYRGRMGLHETLVATDTVKHMIMERAKMEVLREEAIKEGMRTLKQDGIRKITQGVIDLKQVRAVCIK